MNNKTRNKKRGFTLIEILLVIAAISILASIVIVAINPAKQLAEARNAQRRSDVNTILNAIWQYTIDNDGTLPVNLDTSATCDDDPDVLTKEICKADATGTCNTGQDLTVLTASEEYLVSFPADPTGGDTNGTGYFAVQNNNGRVTVCAPSAELAGTVISVRR